MLGIGSCVVGWNSLDSLIGTYTKSVNARVACRIGGQSNFTCPFKIDQSQSLEVTISSPSLFLSQRESFVTMKIFKSKILINFDVFEVSESE